MFFLKYMLLVAATGMFLVAILLVANDMWLAAEYRRKIAIGAIAVEPEPVRWRASVALVCLAWAPLLLALALAAEMA